MAVDWQLRRYDSSMCRAAVFLGLVSNVTGGPVNATWLATAYTGGALSANGVTTTGGACLQLAHVCVCVRGCCLSMQPNIAGGANQLAFFLGDVRKSRQLPL